MELIRFEKISKSFTSEYGSFEALKNISFSIDEGDIFGIIGMSGAGKSTLVRCINKLENLSSGSIFYQGRDISKLSGKPLRELRREIAMIFQHFNLFEQRTVLKNVIYPLEIAGVDMNTARARGIELLNLVGLYDKADSYPSMLSGGQKQRVAIARALSGNPKVILCDEATSALDPETTASILKLLKQINRDMGITLVIITHQMEVLRQICNKTAILDGGNLAECGRLEDLFMKASSKVARRLFSSAPKEMEDKLEVPALNLIFDGEHRDKPIIAEIANQHGIKINILSANMHRLNGKTYGQMLIERPKDDNDCTLIKNIFIEQGIAFEEVN